MKHLTKFNSGLIAIIFVLLTAVFFQSGRYSAHMAYHDTLDVPVWFHIALGLMIISLTGAVIATMVCICWTPQKKEPVTEDLINRWEP